MFIQIHGLLVFITAHLTVLQHILTHLYHSRSGIVVMSDSKLSQNIWQCPSEAVTLILFPSWLEHFTMPSQYDGTRMTISINVMPVGLTSCPRDMNEPLSGKKYGLIENIY